MSFTRNKTADVNTSSTVKAAKRAQKASSAAAANAANAAQNAALTAQNAAGMAQVVAQNAAVVATNAAQTASGAAQTAAAGVSKGVKQGVYNARSWAGPRLDDAAEYCTTTVAPKVSAALHSTARQVTPPKASKRSSVLTWSLLGATILAALGAAAAAARYRYRAAIAADSEAADEEVLADSAGSQAAPDGPDGVRPTTEKGKGQDAETSVNGQVTTSGW
jgi:trimeric autotransporter adhesin